MAFGGGIRVLWTLFLVMYEPYEPLHEKRCLRVNTNRIDPDQLAEIYCLIWNFAILPYILQYPMIQKEDSEGPDQTAQMQSAYS